MVFFLFWPEDKVFIYAGLIAVLPSFQPWQQVVKDQNVRSDRNREEEEKRKEENLV